MRLRLCPPALEWFARGTLSVRREFIRSGDAEISLKLLYASDLHLGAPGSKRVARQLCEVCADEKPDVVLLGGDLVDHRGGLALLGACLRQLVKLAPVYAISGNHDAMTGEDRILEIVSRSGGRQLAKEPFYWPGQNPRIVVEGKIKAASPDSHLYRILCAHYPSLYPKALASGYRLILAGHLHGGQAVLAVRQGKMYPGAFLSRWNGLRFDRVEGTLLVSRGAHDTLPIRWNCPREVILCEIAI